MEDYKVGDIIKMKKQHPCGAYEWEILRIGVDYRLKCTGCGRILLLPRIKAMKMIKE